MSQETTEATKEPEVECSICGRVGGPVSDCEICHGNQRYVQSRAYTRTEEAQGKNPDAPNRYSRTGDTAPKIVHLPGSA